MEKRTFDPNAADTQNTTEVKSTTPRPAPHSKSDKMISFIRKAEKIIQAIVALIIAAGAAIDVAFIIGYNVEHLYYTLLKMAFPGI